MLKFVTRATAALALIASPLLAQDDTRPTVAVLPFVNSAIGAANAELAPLSKGIADLLITDMAMNTGIRVVERENIQKLLEEQNLGTAGRVDDATAARVGKLLGAKHMVTGSFITDRSGTMVVTLKSIDTETGKISWTTRVQDKTDNFLALVAKAAAETNSGLKLPALTPQAKQMGAARAEKAKKVPYAAVLMYSKAISAQDDGKKAEAITLFKETVAKFPDFVDAKVALDKIQGS